MDGNLTRLYEDCAQELRTLENLLEQDQTDLSGCIGGDPLKSYQQNTEVLCQQLEGIKKDLAAILTDGSQI